MSTINATIEDWIEFASAIEQACPKNADRDRFGRLRGLQNNEAMRRLALKWKIENGGLDTLDQAAMIARKMLQATEQRANSESPR